MGALAFDLLTVACHAFAYAVLGYPFLCAFHLASTYDTYLWRGS